ncbi:DUF6807 family protein [Singulisphaera sp. PoT]|uniref:DUF6807 family protein n=1 Tax=Singulisphaera sp. PoT TaxID=3411797 RepID=UPI003BF60FBC
MRSSRNMGLRTRRSLLIAALATGILGSHAQANKARSESGFGVARKAGQLDFIFAGKPIGSFIFDDPTILRPYFANLRALDDMPITRNHPPIPGRDAVDHDKMHPGLWLGFGDINGADFWRNQGRIEHVRFVEEPSTNDGQICFANECRLKSAEGKVLGSLVNQIRIAHKLDGWLLIWDARFSPADGELRFGDQEEMGFGARLATPLIEKNGGQILSSQGKKTAAITWGQPADWCDYSGDSEGRRSGITLMAAPTNFRRAWWHNRDYGVFVANPFGREAMKQGSKSSVVVKAGEELRLRFGAMMHSSPEKAEIEPSRYYRAFLDALGR